MKKPAIVRHAVFLVLGFAMLLGGCASLPKPAGKTAARDDARELARRKPAHGRPYRVKGKTFYPLKSARGYRAEGMASWYGWESGNRTATGARFNPRGLTAAHRTLPLPTRVRVTNLANRRSVEVLVNDRGPYAKGRLIDLSYGAARALGISGTARVEVVALE